MTLNTLFSLQAFPQEEQKYLIPKYSPINVYKSSKLKTKIGILPENRLSFLYLEEEGSTYKILYNKKREGYILKSDVYVSVGNRKLIFKKNMELKTRVPLRFWEEIDKIDNIAGEHLTDFEEYSGLKKFTNVILPVLGIKEIKLNNQKVSLVNLILRFPRLSILHKLTLKKVQPENSILFLVDWSGSMVPEGKRVLLSIFEQMSSSPIVWHKNQKYGALFFREKNKSDQVEYSGLTSFSKINGMVEDNAKKFGYGGTSEEPFLDALHLSIRKLSRKKGKYHHANKVIVALISVETNKYTKKSEVFMSPRNLNFGDMVKLLQKKKIQLIIAQVSPEPGINLTDMFQKNKSRIIVSIPYQSNLSKHILNHLKKAISLDSRQNKKQNDIVRNLARNTINVGGFPVYPNGYKFAKLKHIVLKHIEKKRNKNSLKWVQIPLWTIHNEDLFQITDNASVK